MINPPPPKKGPDDPPPPDEPAPDENSPPDEESSSHALSSLPPSHPRVQCQNPYVRGRAPVTADNSDQASMSTQEWDLNVSGLLGLTNDGVPDSLKEKDINLIFDVGNMRKTFYAPAPGQRRKKKNQERTGRWRAS